MSAKRPALGKGLSALLENYDTDVTIRSGTGGDEGLYISRNAPDIPLERIEFNPFQPRSAMDEAALIELTESIRKVGIVQPITVRKLGYERYQIISGERRFHAAKKAGLTSIPAYIRISNDEGMLELSLIENILREDLNPIDVAIGYRRLIEECGLTQEELSERMGNNRSTVTNFLRLLKLPPEIQAGLKSREVAMGHARALLPLEDEALQGNLYRRIVREHLSVRQVEEAVSKLLNRNSGPDDRGNKPPAGSLAPQHRKIQENLSGRLQTNVALRYKKGKGKIVIPFNSDEQLDGILKILIR